MEGRIEVRYSAGSDYNTSLTKHITFAGGEEHVTVVGPDRAPRRIDILARIKSSQDFIRLLMLKNALDHKWGRQQKPIYTLIMPYLPYARQDRVTDVHFAFSLEVAAELINGMKFDSVICADVHSIVAGALIKNLTELTAYDVFGAAVLQDQQLKVICGMKDLVLIVPDAGAQKRCEQVARFLYEYREGAGCKASTVPLIPASKVRDPATGAIVQTTIHWGSLEGAVGLVVDDICDGGRTFTELGKQAVALGIDPHMMHLFVTHGIFSRGLLELFEFYASIHTTNSWCEYELEESSDVNVIDIYKEAGIVQT